MGSSRGHGSGVYERALGMVRFSLKICQRTLLEDALQGPVLPCPAEESGQMPVFKGECTMEVVTIGLASSRDRGTVSDQEE